MDIKKLKLIAKNSYSRSEVARVLGYKINGRTVDKISKLLNKHNIDISHFKKGRISKYSEEIVLCPVCKREFKYIKKLNYIQTTCSKGCANSFFRTGENNPNYTNGNKEGTLYRFICFKYHKKECIICKEFNIVSVHHFDENNENNNPENLIPLCPTHHTYLHSKYKYLIQNKVEEYINNFKLNLKQ